jgi:hypothetical protein
MQNEKCCFDAHSGMLDGSRGGVDNVIRQSRDDKVTPAAAHGWM